MCTRCTLDAGIETREVLDHEGVPMEHKDLVGDRCYHVCDADDRAPSIRLAYEGNAEPIKEGFAFHLDAEVNNCPSYSVPRLACRQFPAEEMDDQGGRNLHGVPCLYLFALRVTHHIGTKEGGVHIAGESTVHDARREHHYHLVWSMYSGSQRTQDTDPITTLPRVPGGGRAADTGVIPADRVDQVEEAGVFARVKIKVQVAQGEQRGVTRYGRGVDLPGQCGRFVGSRGVGGV